MCLGAFSLKSSSRPGNVNEHLKRLEKKQLEKIPENERSGRMNQEYFLKTDSSMKKIDKLSKQVSDLASKLHDLEAQLKPVRSFDSSGNTPS